MKNKLITTLILTALNITLLAMSPEEHQAVVSKYKFIRTDSKIIKPILLNTEKQKIKIYFDKDPRSGEKLFYDPTIYTQYITPRIDIDNHELGNGLGSIETAPFDQNAIVSSCSTKTKSRIIIVILSYSDMNKKREKFIQYFPIIVELKAKDTMIPRDDLTKFFDINGHSSTSFIYNATHLYPYYNEKAILDRLYEIGICAAPIDSKPLPDTLDKEKYTKSQFNSIEYLNFHFKESPINVSSVVSYNNLAYNLEQSHDYNTSAYLLEKIIEKFPDRTVAYFNLGDAYYGLGQKDKAIKAYQTYIDQMKKKGWEKKIPKRVLERVGN
ncbi:tetratricopeptide repeat protein [Sulfuricurvum sp.]|uniref:tetratricopeptide repeat protein n=1 Tax=Sulfuricurvum sp. TaxID=2025608 RepID=UPI00261FBCBE|nr:tetratricopeptide repeat protein [Sulfuricurvum sp.]MDD3597508.1 tetratricopeptide repeat protein [Sulfuricurvum sp.]